MLDLTVVIRIARTNESANSTLNYLLVKSNYQGFSHQIKLILSIIFVFKIILKQGLKRRFYLQSRSTKIVYKLFSSQGSSNLLRNIEINAVIVSFNSNNINLIYGMIVFVRSCVSVVNLFSKPNQQNLKEKNINICS